MDRVIASAVVGALLLLTGCGSPPQPAQQILSRIPGCSGTTAKGNNPFLQFGTLPQNETSEGECMLPDGSEIYISTWGYNPPDTIDQEDAVYWGAQEQFPGLSNRLLSYGYVSRTLGHLDEQRGTSGQYSFGRLVHHSACSRRADDH